MEKFSWVGVGIAVVGFISTLSGYFKWTWWWKLARWRYTTNQMSEANVRLLYVFIGTLSTAVGIALILESTSDLTGFSSATFGAILSITISLLAYALAHKKRNVDIDDKDH